MSLLRCQYDSYLRNLVTVVTNCTVISKPLRQEFKSKIPKQATHAIQLEDSILFSEGGGQPADHGTIASIPVLYVGRNSNGQVFVCTKIFLLSKLSLT